MRYLWLRTWSRSKTEAQNRVTRDVDETSYADADDVVGGTIFEQSEIDYDEAGNVIETRLRRRHHDATGTGELTTPGGSNPKARVTYVAFYSDPLARPMAVANYGTNGHTAPSRSATVPTRSDDILVTTTEYNDDGEAYKTIDPADKEDRAELDDAGRVTKQIENYTDGDPTTGGNDEDITVCFTYTADGQQATITAKQKSSSDDQTTKYVYGTSLTDSDIARSDLLRAVIYPDSDDTGATGVPPVLSDGADSTYDRVEHKYNRQAQLTETKDQNGTIHAFDVDKLGRQIHDRVTTLGTNIDGAIRRISTTYELRGSVEKITSYDNATVGSGSVVNEVLREYNDFALLDKEYQEHDGAKDGSTLYVGYNYDETATAGEFTNGLRPTSIRYPNGRLVHYTYGLSGSDADNLNRLAAIKDDNSGSPGDTLASYTYLGLGQMVIEDLEEPDVKLDYFGGTSGTYAGFDRFNRIVDQRWYDYAASEDRDRFKYGYDRVSNRVWKENTVSKNLATPVNLDEFYTYDGTHRLKNFDRGELNVPHSAIPDPQYSEAWTLDPLGNWSNYIQKTSGTTDLDQDRAVNKANEITDITEITGTSWPTPSHDRAGNMTTIPQPSDLSSNYALTWDAWNRLVKVEDDSATIAEYTYDGLRRRVIKDVDATIRHFYYTSSWRAVEERLSSSSNPDRQFIWGPLYIDHLILRDRDTSDPLNGSLDERLYALQDANWNIAAILVHAGSVEERYTYSAYGLRSILDGSHSSRASSSYDWRQAFSGRPNETDVTDLADHRSRYHNNNLGRFISRDLVGYTVGGNLLTYANSAPITASDPSGTAPTKNLSVACNGPYPGPRTIKISVQCCSTKGGPPTQEQQVIDGACAGMRMVCQASYLVKSLHDGFPETALDRQTWKFVNRWFGGKSKKVTKKQLKKISSRLKDLCGVFLTKKRIPFECTGACGGYSAKVYTPLGDINLCSPWFSLPADTQAALVVHEMMHKYLGIDFWGDRGYWDNAKKHYEKDGDVVDLDTDKLMKNANTYEEFVLDIHRSGSVIWP